MSNGEQSGATPAPPLVQVPAGWYPDPLNTSLRRYNDGSRWTFWTATPRPLAEPGATEAPDLEAPPSPKELRPDIAQAAEAMPASTGAGKELRLLPRKLRTEESVEVVVVGLGSGFGALTTTNRRILFYFEGMVRSQFVDVEFDAVREVHYEESTKHVEVYTVRRTKRATPALQVVVSPPAEGRRFVSATRRVLDQPRLGAH